MGVDTTLNVLIRKINFISKGQEETSRGNGHVYSTDCADNFMAIYLSSDTPSCMP